MKSHAYPSPSIGNPPHMDAPPPLISYKKILTALFYDFPKNSTRPPYKKRGVVSYCDVKRENCVQKG